MCDPEYNRHFLLNTKGMRTSGLWPLRSPDGTAQQTLRSHPLKTHGSEQAVFHELIDPYFNRGAINAHFGEIQAILAAEIGRWRPGIHDFYKLARRCTEQVAFTLLFGAEEKAEFAQLGDLLHEYHRANWMLGPHLFPFNLPGTPYRKTLARAEALQSFLYERMNAPNHAEFIFHRTGEARGSDGCPFSKERVVGTVAMLSWLSYETMAKALSWTVFLLAQHPAVLADLLDELSAPGPASDIHANRLLSLPLLDAVIKESMRLIAPVPLMSFRLAETGEIAGQHFARGSRFYVLPHLTHRLPELYAEPDRFRPGRWFSIKPTAYEYLPFGAGQRRCPGAWLAMTNLKVALATLLERFRPSIPAGARIDRMYAVVTMPKHGLPVDLVPRGRDLPIHAVGSQSGSIFDLFTPEPNRPVRH
jgi:cytochrome P450